MEYYNLPNFAPYFWTDIQRYEKNREKTADLTDDT
jgi:hypothetical protein